MINYFKEFLPKNVYNNAVSLKKLGINGQAWIWSDALKVINYLCDNNIIILGGDVYKVSNNILKTTCDNWFYNINIMESNEFNSKKSREVAISYINTYHDKYDPSCYYSIVINK